MLVQQLGWSGIKNGRLLQLAEENDFSVLITADQRLKYQQNLKGQKLAIIVLPYNRRKWMPLLVPAIVAALDRIKSGDYIELPLPENLH